MKDFLKRSIGAVVLLASVRAATSAIAPLNNAFMRELGVDAGLAPAVSGTILAVGYVFAVLGPLLGGRLADKRGAVQTYLTGGLIFAAVYFLWGYAPTHSVLYVYRAVLALATGAIYVGAQSYILSGAPEGKKSMGMGIYGLGFGIGSAAGPMLASRIAPLGISRAFVILAISCLVGTVIAFLIVRFVARDDTQNKKADQKNTEDKKSVSGFTIYRQMPAPAHMLVIIGAFFGIAQLAVIGNIDDLGISMGWPLGRAMMGVAVFAIVSMLQPVGGIIGDKFGRSRMVMLGMVFVALGFGALTFIPSPNAIFPLMAVAGFGAMLYTPNAFALIGSYGAEGSKGTLLGFFQGATALGSATGALAAGFLHTTYTVRAPFALTLGVAVLAVVLGIVIIVAEKKRKAQTVN